MQITMHRALTMLKTTQDRLLDTIANGNFIVTIVAKIA